MRKRTQARELALKFLYQIDIKEGNDVDLIDDFFQDFKVLQEVREFAREIVTGCIDNIKKIDKKIETYSKNWSIERMSVIDRNILRLSIFELIYREDIPPKVSINEAIELAKKYSDKESSKFVNGILDRVFKNYKKK